LPNDVQYFSASLGIEFSCIQVQKSDIPKEYIDYWEDIESKTNYSEPSLTPYFAFKVKNNKTNKESIFYFKQPIDQAYFFSILSFLIRSCSWSFRNIAHIKNIGHTNYDKLKNVFGDSFGDFLHALLVHHIDNNKDIYHLALALSGIPDTKLETIKLILIEQDDHYLVQQMMNHPSAKHLSFYC